MPKLRATLLAGGLIAAGLFVQHAHAQRGAAAPDGDWPMYRHDLAGTGYSPLAQITPANVSTLANVWSYGLAAEPSSAPAAPARGGRGPRPLASEATPIVVHGVMYVPGADRVVALDAVTGREIWRHPVAGGAPSRRGVAYWPGDAADAARIIFASGTRLMALDAATGNTVPTFGAGGTVDMVIPYNSVPFVYRNVVVVGANTPPGQEGGIGNPRAYDARTGAKLWEFSSVAQPGDPGHDTWAGDSWRGALGANAWPFYFTMDQARGLLYIPLASPIPGAYGGTRKGANLYGNSVVAVDVTTGKYRWHFQTIHHDIWDADPPAPPSLFDIVRNGTTIPALALTTKSGYMYILNRVTGEPVYGVTETPVPASDVPGELMPTTQPIPVKPPPIARNSYSAADLVTAADTTPEHAAACAALAATDGGVRNNGPFTPWRYTADTSTPALTLVFPGGLGGANWGGVAHDPATGYVFVVTQDDGALGWVEKTADGYDKKTPTVPGAGRGSFDVRLNGLTMPCTRPPWGQLIAVDPSTGDFAWRIPLGVTDSLPADKRHTGRPAMAGPIVTRSGLLFVASTDDNRFRALEAKTGRQLWETTLEKRGNADPMSYEASNGKQYVAVVATDTVMVYALP